MITKYLYRKAHRADLFPFSLGTIVQSSFNTAGNFVMMRSSILQEIAAKLSTFSSIINTALNSPDLKVTLIEEFGDVSGTTISEILASKFNQT